MKELQVTNGWTRTCFGMQLQEVDPPFIVLIQYGREVIDHVEGILGLEEKKITTFLELNQL
jgi:hypothetical protein